MGQKREKKGEEGAEQPVWRTENRRDTPRAVRRGVWCAHVEMWRCRGRGQQSLCSRRGALSRPRPGRRSQHLRLRERSAVARREPAEQGRDARGARREGGGRAGLRTGAPTPAACQASTLGPNGRAPARSPSARFGHVLIAHAGTVLKLEMRLCRLLCSAPPADSSCFTADRHVS